jgi:catechol 2,3-dioxygenase-like lactoylglutathione lyase family enzyme
MLKRVLHTGVRVADLDTAVALYISLGFTVSGHFEKPEPKASVTTVQKDGAAYELWHFEDETHPYVPFISHHIAIYSDDLAHDVDELVSEGYKLVIPITDGVKLRYAFVQDAAGACYEIGTEIEFQGDI